MELKVWHMPVHQRCSPAPEQVSGEHHFTENSIFAAKQHEWPIFTEQPVSLGWAHSEQSPAEQGGLVAASDQSHPSAPVPCQVPAEPTPALHRQSPKNGVWAWKHSYPCQQCRSGAQCPQLLPWHSHQLLGFMSKVSPAHKASSRQRNNNINAMKTHSKRQMCLT